MVHELYINKTILKKHAAVKDQDLVKNNYFDWFIKVVHQQNTFFFN